MPRRKPIHFRARGMSLPLCGQVGDKRKRFESTHDRREVTCAWCQWEFAIFDYLRAGGEPFQRRGAVPKELRPYMPYGKSTSPPAERYRFKFGAKDN